MQSREKSYTEIDRERFGKAGFSFVWFIENCRYIFCKNLIKYCKNSTQEWKFYNTKYYRTNIYLFFLIEYFFYLY